MHFLTFFYLFKPFLYFFNIFIRLLLSLCLTGHLLPLIGSKCFLPSSCMWITFSCFFDGIITFYWKTGILGNVTILDSDTYPPPPTPLQKPVFIVCLFIFWWLGLTLAVKLVSISVTTGWEQPWVWHSHPGITVWIGLTLSPPTMSLVSCWIHLVLDPMHWTCWLLFF